MDQSAERTAAPPRMAVEHKEIRKIDATSFLTQVATDLCDEIHPNLTQEIEEVLPTAIGLMNKLKLTEEMVDAKSPVAWEQGAMILTIAKRWQLATTKGSIEEQRQVFELLTHIYSPETFRCKLSEKTLREPFQHETEEILKEMILRAWPESNGSVEWARDHKGENSIVVLPYRYDMAKGKTNPFEIQDQVYDLLKTPRGKRIYCGGFTMSNQKVYFVYEDTDPLKRQHEANHMIHPGLDVGHLGAAINEAKTEELAFQIASGKLPRIGFFTDTGYRDEVRLLRSLYERDDKLEELIDRRYKDRSLETAQPLAKTLMQDFGLNGYLDLYLANPFIPKNRAHIGKPVIQNTDQIRQRLGLIKQPGIRGLLDWARK